MDLNENLIVKEHVAFLVDFAKKQARDDVGHDPEGAYRALGLAIAELTAAQAAINVDYGLGY